MKKAKCHTQAWTYLNNTLISYEEKEFEIDNEWKIGPDCCNNNLAIGTINSMYIETNEIQDKDDEYKKIKKFLNKFAEYYSNKNGVNIDDLKIEFLNYGKTELVYVLKIKNNPELTLLVKQPALTYGKVKEEANNLIELQKLDENVVAPIDYYSYGDQELYVTPYINQARCVASYHSWGMYVPEPVYCFESFTKEQEDVVTACMIAKLISFYDFDKEEGVVACKLGGGDFMLPKGWELEEPTIDNTLNNLLFIAAREKVHCSFENYLEFIRTEFSRSTINENQESLLINHRGRVKMQMENIEKGIKLGLEIINNRRENLSRKRNKKEN